VQGLTEFLPVSSSGHLVLSQAVMGIEIPGVVFEVALHVATVCAVLWVYRSAVAGLFWGVVRAERESLIYVALLLLASVPAALAGTLAADALEGTYPPARNRHVDLDDPLVGQTRSGHPARMGSRHRYRSRSGHRDSTGDFTIRRHCGDRGVVGREGRTNGGVFLPSLGTGDRWGRTPPTE
jgi:hypothetical protein